MINIIPKLCFQGPINPDVTFPAFDFISEEKVTNDEKNTNETFNDLKKVLNKVNYLTFSIFL